MYTKLFIKNLSVQKKCKRVLSEKICLASKKLFSIILKGLKLVKMPSEFNVILILYTLLSSSLTMCKHFNFLVSVDDKNNTEKIISLVFKLTKILRFP